MRYFAFYDGAAVVSFGSSGASKVIEGEITKAEYDALSTKYAEAREYETKYRAGEIAAGDVPEEIRIIFPAMFEEARVPSDDDEIDDSEALAIITGGIAQ